MAFVNRLKEGAKKLSGGDVFAAFCAAFVFSSLFFVFGGDFQDLAYVRQYPILLPLSLCIGAFAVLTFLSLFFKTNRITAIILLCLSLVLAVTLVIYKPGDIFFAIGVSTVLILTARYVMKDDKLGICSLKLSDTHSLVAVALMAAVFCAAVYLLTRTKYHSFYHSAFDFGIFCQMFESMATTGLPYTTVERSEQLSHFAVHFSPFFYLLLPGYFLWRSPLYLLFAQAFGIAVGAFAVRKIARSLGFSPGGAAVAAAVYLLFPTMANGCFYDFHENKFLSALILWAVAFALEKKMIGTGIFLFLILTVKEDAFIYVLAICLWMTVTKRNRVFALAAAAFSVGWFFFACSMIQLSGGEIMTGRFSNFVSGGEGGLADAVRTCFIDVGYLIKEVFSGADTEAYREMTYSGQKLEFVLWTAFPLLFAPFLRKHPSELVLLLPLLVINLMPDWLYQYDVDFQYTYGTAALMIASALMFLAERKKETLRGGLLAMLLVCCVFAVSLVYPKASYYWECYYNNKEEYRLTESALDMIPEDSSVTAYGYVVPHLWYVEELRTCPEYYKEMDKTDYYVIDTRYEHDGHTKKMYEAMEDDYRLVAEKGYVKIYSLRQSNG